MKKILVLLVVLAALAPAGLFAASNPFDYSATEAGDVLLNVGVSLGWGIGVEGGADFILGKFDIPSFPIEWGIGVRGLAEVGWYYGFDWGAAGLWTLHKSMTFGNSLNFDWYIGLGVGLAGYTGYTGFMYAPIGLGFASADGVAWQLTDNMWLQLEYVGIYGAGFLAGYTVSTSIGSIGLRFAL